MAQSLSQFDFLCAGVASPDFPENQDNGGLANTQTPYSIRLRTDLAGRTFCENECNYVEVIAKTDAQNITFRESISSRLVVSRNNGDFFALWIVGAKSKTMTAFGRCSTLPFTPIPNSSTSHSEKIDPHRQNTQIDRTATARTYLSSSDAVALLFVSDHRPISAALHTRLHALGYIELDQDLWQLTKKGRREVEELRAKLGH